MNPQTVQTAIVQTIGSAVPNLHVYDYDPPSIGVPAVFVSLLSLTPDATFDASAASATFLVQVVVGSVAEKGAQAQLYGYITPGSSVLGAIRTHPTFGGAVQSSKIGEISISSRTANDGSTRYWAANIPVEVHSIQ